MTASKKEIKSRLGFAEEERREPIDEAEIIDCIDSCLNYLGRNVAYTVYLNWSGVDRERHMGILGDPRSFRTSLFNLFGEEKGSLIETFLVKKFREHFPAISVSDDVTEDSDFVTVINWLTRRARDDDLILEEGELAPYHDPGVAFFDSLNLPMDKLDKWFSAEVSRVGLRIRLLSNLPSGIQRGDLDGEVAKIALNYEEAVA